MATLLSAKVAMFCRGFEVMDDTRLHGFPSPFFSHAIAPSVCADAIRIECLILVARFLDFESSGTCNLVARLVEIIGDDVDVIERREIQERTNYRMPDFRAWRSA